MYHTVCTVESPSELKSLIPFDEYKSKNRSLRIKQVEDILCGRDKRKLAIVGPCSADNIDAVCDYAHRLSKLAAQIKDRIMVVMRVYTSKPRTRGEGYMGILHNPDPQSEKTDISAGLKKMRELHVRIASETELPTADEMLYPEAFEYIDDVVSYGMLGARSSDDPLHRFAASGLDMPLGVKNSLDGNMSELINSLHAIGKPCEFLYNGKQVRTDGNVFAHAVLRGAKSFDNTDITNYEYDGVMRLNEMCVRQGIVPAVVIDAGHSNSGKRPDEQIRIVDELLSCAKRSDGYNSFFKGFMIESYIHDGCQSVGCGVYGKSITDGCLGWEKTEKLLLSAADAVIL